MVETDKHPGTITYIKRGIGYALTSVFALFSGFLIQSEKFMSIDMLLLIVPISLTIPFFIIYSICFHYDPPENIINDKVLKMQQVDALKIWPIIGIILSLLVVMVYRLLTGAFPCIELLGSFLFYGCIFNIYAFLLNKMNKKNGNVYLRHQIAWPTIITIAFSMYFGQFFSKNDISYHTYLPVIVIVLFFIVTEAFKFSKKTFLLSSFFLFFIFILAISLGKLELIPSATSIYFSSMIFFVPISAYLASFESWRISSYIAQLAHHDIQQNNNLGFSKINDMIGHPFPNGNPASYYFATLSSLLISILLIPFVFIFSDYGIIFIAGFLLHSIISFYIWTINGNLIDSLSRKDWTANKLIYGFIFLFLLVVDAKFNLQPSKYLLSDFVSWSGLSFLFILSSFPTKKLWHNFEIEQEKNSENLKKSFIDIFHSRSNYIYAIAPISVSACTFILIIMSLHNSPLNSLKSNYSFIVYSVFILLSFISTIALNLISKNEIKKFAITSAGFFLTTRMMTSSLVGLSVLLPSLSKGNSIILSINSCLPFMFASMGGFALNDFFDHRKDKINEPTRAIPSGKISANNTFAFSIFLLIISFFSAVSQSDNKTELFIYLYPLLGVIFYNIIVKKFTYLKNVYTSLICLSPLMYDVIVFDYNDIFLLIPVSSFFFILGREILMDIKDIPGDTRSGIVTLPMLIGINSSEKLCFFLQFFGIFFLVPFVIFSNTFVAYSILLVLLSSTFLSSYFWKNIDKKNRSLIIKSMRLPMLLSLSLLIF